MSEEIIRSQREAIGILLEVVKRYQANSDLDEEYVRIAAGGGPEGRAAQILEERRANSEAISRLLSRLEE